MPNVVAKFCHCGVCFTGVRATTATRFAHSAHHYMTQIEWYSKEEAGVRLGTQERPLSPRRVLELAKEGRIQSDRFRDPKTNQMVIRIAAGSVERFIDERKAGLQKPLMISEEIAKARGPRELREPRTPQSFYAQIAALPAEPLKLFLTLSRAVDYSGLPTDVLAGFISTGKLPALDIGAHRRGGRWRIRRVDLDNMQV